MLLLPPDGWTKVDRLNGRTTIARAGQTDYRAAIHPDLGHTAAVVARWSGNHCFHAGAVDFGAGALALFANKGGGKSSTLGFAHTAGAEVLADDVVVITDDAVFAGPRSLDLRPDAARQLGLETLVGHFAGRERHRLALPPCRPETPLRGFVTLAWGDRVEAVKLPASARLARLIEGMTLRLEPRDPVALLKLTAVPAWVVTRPRSLDVLPEVAELLSQLR